MEERRKSRRYRVRFLITVEKRDEGVWHVISRDMSPTGAMFAASPLLAVGERVTLTFEGGPVNDETYKVEGSIVRAEHNAEDPQSMWPDQVAVEFENPIPALEEFLQKAAELLERRYPSSIPPP